MEDHLKGLLENTPSSRMKLLAAWDGLSSEIQIKLLHALTNGACLHLSFHRDIIVKALKSSNEYIRYLAARSRDLDKDSEIVKQLAADESPLVRYAQDELRPYFPGQMGPTEFWDLPKPKQLAIARAESPPYCCDFAEFLMCAIETRGATDDELSDVVFEYVKNPWVKKREYQHEDLWKIVPKMPKGVAWKLVDNLSAEYDRHVLIPPTVLDWLQDGLLTWLLCREDVHLEEFRKRVFQSRDEKYTDANRIAAASRNFAPTFEEFHTLLKEQSARLEMLACLDDQPIESMMFLGAFPRPLPLDNLRLLFNEFLKDYFAVQNKKEEDASGAFRRRIKRFEGKLLGKLPWQDTEELRELKIYRLARRVMPWHGKRDENVLCEPLRFLAEKVVEGDTWATFMAFHTALSETYNSYSGTYAYDRYLPILPEIGEIASEENEPPAKPARTDISQVSQSVTLPAPDWLDWMVSILRRMFR